MNLYNPYIVWIIQMKQLQKNMLYFWYACSLTITSICFPISGCKYIYPATSICGTGCTEEPFRLNVCGNFV